MSGEKRLQFSIDSSSLIQAWSRAYPLDAFPTFWDKMSEIVDKRVILTPDVVLDELKKKDDGLYDWVEERKEHLIYPLDGELQKVVKDILGKFPRLVDTKRGRSGADPFVIALAKITGRTVVTDEIMGKPKNPSIVDVCQHYDIECINLLAMIRRLRFKI